MGLGCQQGLGGSAVAAVAQRWHPEVTLTCDPIQSPHLGVLGISPKKTAELSSGESCSGSLGARWAQGPGAPPCPSTQRCSQHPSSARGWQHLVNH